MPVSVSMLISTINVHVLHVVRWIKHDKSHMNMITDTNLDMDTVMDTDTVTYTYTNMDMDMGIV